MKKLEEKDEIADVNILDPMATGLTRQLKCVPNSYKYPPNPQISGGHNFRHFGAHF